MISPSVAQITWKINQNKLDITKCKANFSWFDASKSTGTINYNNTSNAYFSLTCVHPAWPHYLVYAYSWQKWLEQSFMLTSSSYSNTDTNTSTGLFTVSQGKWITPWTSITISYNTIGYKKVLFYDYNKTGMFNWENFYYIDPSKPTGTISAKITHNTAIQYRILINNWWEGNGLYTLWVLWEPINATYSTSQNQDTISILMDGRAWSENGWKRALPAGGWT